MKPDISAALHFCYKRSCVKCFETGRLDMWDRELSRERISLRLPLQLGQRKEKKSTEKIKLK